MFRSKKQLYCTIIALQKIAVSSFYFGTKYFPLCQKVDVGVFDISTGPYFKGNVAFSDTTWC